MSLTSLMSLTPAALAAGPSWDAELSAWWSLLCAVAALNVLAWAASAVLMRRCYPALQLADQSAVRWQILLSAGYVLGCAYRSAFPVYDIQRLCIVDSWLSSVIVGRSVATIAELCFVAQWALMLQVAARSGGHPAVPRISRLLVPLIAVAEVCSWYSVVTTSNIGHVVEESLWGLCAAMLLAGLVLVWPRSPRELRPVLGTGCVLALAYVMYMFQVDVPMYWSRWLADTAQAREYLSVPRGLVDASGRWVISHRWDDWKSEVVWMSLYFSVGVWLSIGLIHVSARWHAGRRIVEPARLSHVFGVGPALRRDAH